MEIQAREPGFLSSRAPRDRMNHVTFGGGGFASSDVEPLLSDGRLRLYAICDVDEERCRPMRDQYPDAHYFRDWRELFVKEAANFDSCNVATPDHMHASIAMTALRHGKHVYCQKPLCHTLVESRRLAEEAAARPDLVTQLGVQRHSEPEQYRQAVQIIQMGVIGSVHTVYSWSVRDQPSRPPLPGRSDPVPSELDWDLWLGVAEDRPYLDGYYHPGAWRARLDFGLGRFGDFAPHILDPVYTALGLSAPTLIQSLGPPPTAGNWPVETELVYHFPSTPYTTAGGLTLAWFDGNRAPPQHRIADLAEIELPSGGSAFVGTDGTLLLQHFGHPPRLFPEARFRGIELPELPPRGHRTEFVDACWGVGSTSAPFAYAGPLNELIVAGTVAQRFPNERLEWDATNLWFTNIDEANRLLHRDYRAGWQVEGLSRADLG